MGKTQRQQRKQERPLFILKGTHFNRYEVNEC